MKKIQCFLILLLCTPLTGSSQSYFDALRYNGNFFQSNARSMAVGNAFGALGANGLSGSINPAGLAAYSRSEISASFQFADNNASSRYLGGSYFDDRATFSLGQLDMAFTDHHKREGLKAKEQWLSSHFSISLNRTNDFNQRLLFQGVNNQSGIIDHLAEDLTNTWFNRNAIDSNTYGGMAYFAYLVDPVYGEDDEVVGFQPSVRNPRDRAYYQRQSFLSTGNMYDLNINFAGNYGNRVLLGASIGLPFLSYNEKATFFEENDNKRTDNFNELSLSHEIQDRGMGVYVAAGFIAKPTKFLRLGLALRSPTYYSINRQFTTTLVSRTDSINTVIDPDGYTFDYQMNSSFRLNASTALIIRKSGFFSVDYTFSDPSLSRLKDLDYGAGLYIQENQDIAERLTGIHQIRIGAEYLLGKMALRAGYSYTSSGIKNEYQVNIDNYSVQSLSGGLGFRNNNHFIDFAYEQRWSSEFFQPYSHSEITVDGASIRKNAGRLMITAGYNF